MIRRLRLPLYANHLVVNLELTNRASLVFSSGHVSTYSGPRDFNLDKQYGRWDEMKGTIQMTTNEVLALATNAIFRLGYKLETVTHGWPLKIEGPLGWDDRIHYFPFFYVEWSEPEGLGATTICIDADRKEVAGIVLSSRKIHRPDPKFDVVPDTWAQHREEFQRQISSQRQTPTSLTIPSNLHFLGKPPKAVTPDSKK